VGDGAVHSISAESDIEAASTSRGSALLIFIVSGEFLVQISVAFISVSVVAVDDVTRSVRRSNLDLIKLMVEEVTRVVIRGVRVTGEFEVSSVDGSVVVEEFNLELIWVLGKINSSKRLRRDLKT